jgi:ATP-dependent RNA helicase SUPV3L1/SUV3
VVAFSAAEVYAIAELIRRQRGGAAVVLGALSPRTRNAQVALYQSGDVDFLVATDAIGMGLNLDVDHVAFAGVRKFDGQVHRDLTPGELAQIAGRAGRHMNDGTFGVTGTVEPLSADVIDRIETHTFEPVKSLQWRNRDLDFTSLDRLRDSLREAPREGRLTRARMADDVAALEAVSHDREVTGFAVSRQAVARLWDVCQIPDYRKISGQNHAELIATLYKFLMGPSERIPEDWFAQQVALADRTDGDIDTLANRIAHIRTWTFVSNRVDWLADHEHWQGRTRAIEDSLSDALHEQLTQRFIDRRTSALMRGLKEKDELYAEIADDGAVHVEKHFVGRLQGFRFFPVTGGEGIHGKATRNAAAHVLARELALRVRRVAAAKSDAFRISRNGHIVWRDAEIARLEAGDDPLKPSVVLLADEHLSAADKDRLQERLNTWMAENVAERLNPLVEIAAAQDITGLARGIAFRLKENFGVLRREGVTDEIRSLDQTARAQLRKYGVRFGAFNIYFPALLKPACSELAVILWVLKQGGQHGLDLATMPELPRPGLTSVPTNPLCSDAFYGVLGFHVCGPRAVRVDMLERLADLIRTLLAWRADPANPSAPPRGATGDGGFRATPDMMSILGCSASELGNVLKALGFWAERRRLPALAAEPVTAAPAEAPAPRPGEVDGASAAIAGEPPLTVEPETPPAPEPIEPAPPAGEPAAAPVAAAAAATESEAERWEEIWRPRRRGRPVEAGAERPKRVPRPPRKNVIQQAAGPAQQREAKDKDREKDRPRRHQHQQGRRGGPTRREERTRLPMQASPPPSKATFDPDSPFAALSSLKAAMEKRSQD